MIFEFWHDYGKPKYGETPKLCQMNTDSFIRYVKKIILIKILQKMLKQYLTLKFCNKQTIT